jgi:DnaJ-class molecular chaperone
MDANEDPYDILGVPHGASDAEIRSAYRKLALQTHPDKQTTEEARQSATHRFAKISNAYELLSDPAQRQEYDLQQQPAAAFDPQFAFHHHFHDPFQVFESFFRQEFGGGGMMRNNNDPFARPFMSPFGPFGGGGGMMMDPFGSDPFGSRGMDPFGSLFGNRRDPFQDMFQSMQQQMQSSQGPNTRVYSYSSTTTSSAVDGGDTVTTQTTTRVIDGREETVKERIVRKADGTVERHVESSTPQQQQQLEAPPPQQLPLPENDSKPHFRLPWQKESAGSSSTTTERHSKKRQRPPAPDQDHRT